MCQNSLCCAVHRQTDKQESRAGEGFYRPDTAIKNLFLDPPESQVNRLPAFPPRKKGVFFYRRFFFLTHKREKAPKSGNLIHRRVDVCQSCCCAHTQNATFSPFPVSGARKMRVKFKNSLPRYQKATVLKGNVAWWVCCTIFFFEGAGAKEEEVGKIRSENGRRKCLFPSFLIGGEKSYFLVQRRGLGGRREN